MQPELSTRLADIVPAIVERLPRILAEVRDLLADEHPDYARFLTDEFDDVIASARGFAGRLVGIARSSPDGALSDVSIEQTLFEEIGRAHYEHGQDVTGLLAAYRAGAAVAWRHVAQIALGLGATSEEFAMLAAAVFTAVDQLSGASLRGYAQEQSESALVAARLREELADLLLSDRCDSAAIRAAAVRAEWPLPKQAAVVLIDPEDEDARTVLARLDPSCLRLCGPDLQGAIVPDPAGPARRARLVRTLRGAHAVVGASVPIERLPASLHVARIAMRLRKARLLADDPLFVGEHLDALIVHHDEQLLAALRSQYLAPLEALPAPSRERLATTLTSWLRHMGNRQAVAGELHVHPQTVRYRLAQLRELFGDALDDPDARSNLLLALAWGPAADERDGSRTGAEELPRPRGGTRVGCDR